ncbi:MAG: TlpA family protein disulfide reductase [Bacteroidetes bacterium]|nr:TlpA family protein disulfide reductase [Bacteroidota bacterium]
MRKIYISIIYIIFLLSSCSKAENPIISTAFNKIKNANSYNIRIIQLNSFTTDTTITYASPLIKFISKNDVNYELSAYKFLYFEESKDTGNWFNLTLMDGNNWYIKKDVLNTYNLKDDNNYANFKSNFSDYSVLFYPKDYFSRIFNWELKNEEKIENENTWLFERSYKDKQGFNVLLKANISKVDTFLRQFTIICSDYEKLHEPLEIFYKLDILSHKSLGTDCDSIFDINIQKNKFNKENKNISPIISDIKSSDKIIKDTADILLNSNLMNMNGDVTKLSSNKGKWILVDFWYVGCYPCYKAMDFLNKMAVKYKDNGLVIYGINPMDNDRKALTRLFNDKGLTYQYLIDPKGNCVKKIGITGYPTMYLISPDNKIVWQHYGYTPSMDAELEKIIENNITRK